MAGIACYRIPAILQTDKGTLIAFAEARHGSCGDANVHTIASRRSTDGGKTWGPVITAAGNESQHVGNPTVVFTASKKALMVYVLHDPSKGADLGKGNGMVVSEDDGLTWSAPRDISKGFGPASGSLPGPGHALQLSAGAAGAHAGRIMVPSHHSAYAYDYVKGELAMAKGHGGLLYEAHNTTIKFAHFPLDFWDTTAEAAPGAAEGQEAPEVPDAPAAAHLTAAATSGGAAAASGGGAAATAAAAVFLWDFGAAIADEGLTYEEQAVAMAYQGIVNGIKDETPSLFIDSGKLDFDWPAADSWWAKQLSSAGRVEFTKLPSTLCGLLTSGADRHKRVRGTSVYADTAPNLTRTGARADANTTARYPKCSTVPGPICTCGPSPGPGAGLCWNCISCGSCVHCPTCVPCAQDRPAPTPPSPAPPPRDVGDGVSLAVGLTLAGQQQLLPVTPSMLRRHTCLAKLPARFDIRTLPGVSAGDRVSAWRWAIDHLLANSSRSVVFNLNRWRTHDDPEWVQADPQSRATATTIDYAVQQKAFVVDLETRVPNADGSKPPSQTPQHLGDEALLERAFASHFAPLFSAYGWSDDEYSWTNLTSVLGGAVFCSFATPSLSFWSTLPTGAGAPGTHTSRPWPSHTDSRGIKLNRSKYYLTFETNEGDTPRIIDSAFGSSWASEKRGSVPVGWAIDPVLAVQFPALFDFYAATATQNDSFVAGVGGGGYVYLNALNASVFRAYASRVGRLLKKYGTTSGNVVDTYGFADLDLIAQYSQIAGEAGHAPDAYISHRTNWTFTGLSGGQACSADGTPINSRLVDGTPVLCTDGPPWLFYFAGGLNKTCPSCDLANRILTVARKHPSPLFMTTYGGLHWTTATVEPQLEFWTLLHDTVALLGEQVEVVGAQEMARLSREAGKGPGLR